MKSKMRKITVLASLLSIAVLLASGFGNAAVPAPLWTIGNWWKYDITIVMKGSWSFYGQGSINSTVIDEVTHAVNKTTSDTFLLRAAGDGNAVINMGMGDVPVTFTQEAYSWIEKTNYSQVEQMLWMNVTGMGFPVVFYHLENYSGAENFYDFPLDTGKGWWSNTTRCIHEEMPFGMKNDVIDHPKNNYLCLRNQTLSVPAGAYNAYIVNRTTSGTSNSTEYAYADAVGNYIMQNVTESNSSAWKKTTTVLSSFGANAVPEFGGAGMFAPLAAISVFMIAITIPLIMRSKRR
jgi:hypothetical protein